MWVCEEVVVQLPAFSSGELHDPSNYKRRPPINRNTKSDRRLDGRHHISGQDGTLANQSLLEAISNHYAI